jgi:hypothetical protein
MYQLTLNSMNNFTSYELDIVFEKMKTVYGVWVLLDVPGREANRSTSGAYGFAEIHFAVGLNCDAAPVRMESA